MKCRLLSFQSQSELKVGFGIGLRLFETVSKDNIASYKSALSASNVKVVEEMEHNELYLEILPE